MPHSHGLGHVPSHLVWCLSLVSSWPCVGRDLFGFSHNIFKLSDFRIVAIIDTSAETLMFYESTVFSHKTMDHVDKVAVSPWRYRSINCLSTKYIAVSIQTCVASYVSYNCLDFFFRFCNVWFVSLKRYIKSIMYILSQTYLQINDVSCAGKSIYPIDKTTEQ